MRISDWSSDVCSSDLPRGDRPQDTSRAWGGGMTATVLVVDDDAAIRTVIARALDRAGHDVVAAGSLAEMRRALDRGLPDVLVTDVVLPDGNGQLRRASCRESVCQYV